MPIPQLTRSPKGWEKYKKMPKKLKKRLPKKRRKISLKELRRRKREKRIKKLIAWLITLAIIGTLIGGIFLIGAFAWYSRDLPDPNKVIDRIIAESTKIYDRTGETLLWEIHGDEKRTIVQLDQISDYIKWATISAEDKHFYEHHGINVFSIIQGVILDPLRGRRARGGSTLTQQLVKNAILTNERSVARKIKEWILSYQIERKFEKDQILKMYFNEIPYGSVNYGVESASNYFFGKSAKDINLAEAAILAALPQAPTRLSPYGSHTEQLFNRQHWILDEMVEVGYISKEEAETAKNVELEFKKEQILNIKAPHFVFYVRELLAEKLGEKVLEQGGLKVITTLDWEKQQVADDAVHNAQERILEYGATNAAMVSIDAKTGEVLAMVGSMDFTNDDIDGQVNVAIMPRQPGSSIKPVGYAAAFEKGFTTETVLYDVLTTFPSNPKPYAPNNYDFKERGAITIRRALGGSLNIPAVKALYLGGIENVKVIMQNMGYSTISEETQCGLSLVLGGCEVKLVDHVGAFTTFARDGERAETAAILKVQDKDGKTLDEFKPQTHKVLEKNTARQINSILSDDNARAWVFGAGSQLTLPGRPVGAKTGTTNDNNDAWTIGFTPSYVTGVWVGNSDGTDMKNSATGSSVAAPIWNEYMRTILADTPVEYFKSPAELSEDLPGVLRGETTGETEIEIDKASGKLATPLTPESYIEKKIFRQDHSILHYVNKNNPTGGQPENPGEDPMYGPWEAAIEEWLKKQAEEKGEEFVREMPPTEHDDLHVPENIPTITLITPKNNQTLENYPLNFDVQASAPRGVSRVVYELADEVIGVSRIAPYNLQIESLDAANGYQQLKATVYDDIDNSNSVQIELNLKLPQAPVLINWLNPRQDATIPQNISITIDFTLSQTKNLDKLTFYYLDEAGSTNKIANVLEFNNEQMSIVWQNTPGPGAYAVYAEFLKKDSTTSQSNRLKINIQ
ncbi:penicillin-binding protein [Patescibacteria group bacterium]